MTGTVSETGSSAAPAESPADAAFLVDAPGIFDALASRFDSGSRAAREALCGSVHRVLQRLQDGGLNGRSRGYGDWLARDRVARRTCFALHAANLHAYIGHYELA